MKNEIEKIMEAAEKYAAYVADDDAAGDGWAEEEAYKQAIISVIERLAKKHGWLVGCQYDGISTYIDCDKESEDGTEMVDSFQVRISNHKQAYAGPVWSFQPDHSGKMVRLGFEEIEKRMQENN